MKQITGWHVFAIFALGFGTIMAVNIALAVNAVRTFPGLEVKNSYVASQSFDRDRSAQEALGWTVSARLSGDTLVLAFKDGSSAVAPVIESAVFGRATTVASDQIPSFAFDGEAFVAPVAAGDGNWNLRIIVRAADGTIFKQRIVVETDT